MTNQPTSNWLLRRSRIGRQPFLGQDERDKEPQTKEENSYESEQKRLH